MKFIKRLSLLTCQALVTKFLIYIHTSPKFLKRKNMSKNKKRHHETEAEDLPEELNEALGSGAEDEFPEPEAADESETETDYEADETDVELLKAENAKLREDYLRAFAEAENTKKRCAQEIEKNNKYAISSFAKNLLSVADNLHRAIEAVSKDEGNENCEALKKGVELTEAELMKVFEKFGITRMEIMGKVFDPNFHQVIQEVEDKSKPAGTVIAELQTGYMLNGRLLREAMVVVTK